MADKNQLLQIASEALGPEKLQQMVSQAEESLANDPDVTAEALSGIIEMFEFALENPDEYPDIVKEAVQTGAMDEGDLPEEYDHTFIAIILLALYELRDSRGGQQEQVPVLGQQETPAFKKGGLVSTAKHIQKQGSGSDTILAHISPTEAAMLKRRGGAGSINPITGLREYGLFKKLKKAVKSVVKAVAPIVKAVAPMVVGIVTLNPYLAAATGAALGATGGGGIKGAILGGLGGYMATPGNALASNVGGFANDIIGNAGGLSNQVLGSTLIGGATSGLQGKNVLLGGLTAGLVSNYAPKLVEAYGTSLPPEVANTMSTAAQAAANTGSGIKGILTNAGVAGLTQYGANLMNGSSSIIPPSDSGTPAPTDMVTLDDGSSVQYQDMVPGSNYTPAVNPTISGIGDTGMSDAALASTVAEHGVDPSSISSTMKDWLKDVGLKNILATGVGLAAFMEASKAKPIDPAQSAADQYQAIVDMLHKPTAINGQNVDLYGSINAIGPYSKHLRGYEGNINRYGRQGAGGEHQYFDRSMPLANIPGGAIIPSATGTAQPLDPWTGMVAQPTAIIPPNQLSLEESIRRGSAYTPQQYARGGYVSGGGTGQSDSIHALLSNGEYVMDADTVAALGDGSTDAGVSALDKMREEIRKHRRSAPVTKIPPKAKTPMQYVKGRK